MRNWQGRRVTLREHVLRLLGVVSPSGAYPLPPRWAMSKLGRSRYHQVTAAGDRSVAAGGDIGHVSTGNVWDDIAGGPLPVRDPGTHFRVPTGALTAFSTGDPQHTHGWTPLGMCGPTGNGVAACFAQQPYVPRAARSASVCQPRSGCTCGSQPSGCADAQSGGEGSC